MGETIRIQIHHTPFDHSNPYPESIESALNELTKAGLHERGWDQKADAGFFRHETGAEMIVLIAGLVELTSAILHLIAASRAHKPETKVSITLSNPSDISRILAVINPGSTSG
jgi:hypothetical protein